MPRSIAQLHRPADMARALSLLVSGYPPAEQPGYLDTLSRLVSRPAAAEELIVLESSDGGRRTGVALAQLLAGKAALVWPVRAADSTLALELLRLLIEQLRARNIVVTQALTAPEQREECQLFREAELLDGGELLYMAASVSAFLEEPPSSEIAYEVVAPDDPELSKTIAATYEGSLDCPLVDGWRDIEDVLAGYAATGTYRPGLWRLLRRNGETLGCLVLSDFPEHGQGELTYLGIHPNYRGRGLGLAATRWLLHFAQDIGWQQVLLAVDANNRPAIAIYAAAGFKEVAVRRLLARRLA